MCNISMISVDFTYQDGDFPCEEGAWQCETTYKCIDPRLVCDGDPQCADGTDETDCGKELSYLGVGLFTHDIVVRLSQGGLVELRRADKWYFLNAAGITEDHLQALSMMMGYRYAGICRNVAPVLSLFTSVQYYSSVESHQFT